MPLLSIDEFVSSAGWTSNTTLVVVENEAEDFIASLNDKSLLVKFDGNKDDFVEKTISVDVTGFDEIRLWMISVYKGRAGRPNYKNGSGFADPSDFAYKIDFGFDEFFLPVLDNFFQITVAIPVGTTVTKIKITALHDDLDVLIFSHLIAVQDEIPLDILRGIKTAIERETDLTAISSGTGTGVAGENELTVTGIQFIDRHSQIKIGSERHVVADVFYGATTTIRFDKQLDGKTLLANHANDPLFLELPVLISRRRQAYIGNSITVSSDVPDKIRQDGEESFLIDTFRVAGTVETRTVGITKSLAVQIDCESQHEFILQRLQRAAQAFIGRVIFYANGINLEAYQVSSARIEAESLDVVPRISFVAAIEFTEDIWPRINQAFPLSGSLILNPKVKV